MSSDWRKNGLISFVLMLKTIDSLSIGTISVACLLTFLIDKNRIDCVLSSNEDIISLFKATTNIHQHIYLKKKQIHRTTF